MVAPDGPHLPWPAVGDAQIAVGHAFEQFSFSIDQNRLHKSV